MTSVDELERRGLVRPTRDPFALPRGRLGRLAGRLMARSNREEQRAVAAVVEVPPAGAVLEVGFGPGALVAMLLDAHPGIRLGGVDPSPAMVEQAARRNAEAVRVGRVDLRVGAAAELPWEDGTFDAAVSVNNVTMWPDVGAGAGEIRRVLAPGGQAVVAWHSRSSPKRLQARLGLPDDRLDDLAAALSRGLGDIERRDLGPVVAFLARV
jgi:SAM-dependent methyltransferase